MRLAIDINRALMKPAQLINNWLLGQSTTEELDRLGGNNRRWQSIPNPDGTGKKLNLYADTLKGGIMDPNGCKIISFGRDGYFRTRSYKTYKCRAGFRVDF